MLQCQDCMAFAESLNGALPYLDPKIFMRLKSRQSVLVIFIKTLRCSLDILFILLQWSRNMKQRRKQDLAGCTLTASILGIILLTAGVVVLTVFVNKHQSY